LANNSESVLELIPVVQEVPDQHIDDISAAVASELNRAHVSFRPGSQIAIAVGSRGIANIQIIVGTLVDGIRRRGGDPFVVPAMGSHGGATARGQTQVLASYGITETAVGAPIRSSMEVVDIPAQDAPCPVVMDRFAYEADGVVVVNRVKRHTDFHGPHESGLVKMLAIGLGNQQQALEIHRNGIQGLRELMPRVASDVLATGKIKLGLGIVENPYHKTAVISAVRPEEFHARDRELLDLSKSMELRLPAETIDILLVDFLGKDLSGTGLDTNVIGRLRIAGEPDPTSPRIRMIVVCGISPESHGNAIGVGLADVITSDLANGIDHDATTANVLTSTFYERGKVPIVAPTAQAAYEWAARGCRTTDPDSLRVVRIRSTQHLQRVLASRPIWEEIRTSRTIRQDGEFAAAFDGSGQLRQCWSASPE
jgi:hypothetical protein